MNTTIPADSGSGFLVNTAAFAVILFIVLVAVCLPTVRSAVSDHFSQFRTYFIGPDGSNEGADSATPSTTAGPAGEEPTDALPTGRASDRDQHQFDLSVFNSIFGGTVDDPSKNP